MLATTKNIRFVRFIDYQNVGPIMNFLSVFTHACGRMFCDVRVCYKQMTVAEKAMHTTRQLILQESLFSDV